MTQLKLLSAAFVTAAIIASPAIARHHHAASQYYPDDAYVAAAQGDAPYAFAYANHRNDVRCVSAPRVGQFASDQWDNDVPCIPGTMSY
jgi:hypothetical protein